MPAPAPQQPENTPTAPPPLVRAYGQTDVGKKRQHNEDAFLVDEKLGLYVVCDGMGGHAAGEVAAAQAVTSVKEVVEADKSVLEAFKKDPIGGREQAEVLAENA